MKNKEHETFELTEDVFARWDKKKMDKKIRMTKRQLLSIMFYHIGHNVDRLLWMISPTHEWLEDKLADLYQWAMRKSAEYDDYYKVWKKST